MWINKRAGIVNAVERCGVGGRNCEWRSVRRESIAEIEVVNVKLRCWLRIAGIESQRVPIGRINIIPRVAWLQC
jgi:hypothetical protein